MEKLKAVILNWLYPDLAETIGRVTATIGKLETAYAEVEKHLESIAQLGAYLKEKESQAEELFSTFSQIGKDFSSKTVEEIEEKLQEARVVLAAAHASPAVGRAEITEKSRQISGVTELIMDLEKELKVKTK